MSSKSISEVAILASVQAALVNKPGAIAVARGLSHFGEHSLGWIALAGVGAAMDPNRRRQWLAAGVGAFGAHAASVVVKRIVRRPRPHDESITINVSTPSKLSFPSSHATSTTAAAILLGRLTGLPLPAVFIPPMMLSRLLLGVHYPTDVLAGAAVGATAAAMMIQAEHRIAWLRGEK
ncbi:MAG: phosphatase PAP2 family protein [Mycobacteriaceae bacterium]